MTGFTREQVIAVLSRDMEVCALFGILPRCRGRATTANHRQNRQAGGSKLRNGLGNACAICDYCNDRIESDADARRIAIERGVKLLSTDDPERVPMWSPVFRTMVQPKDTHLELIGGPYQPREVTA